MSDTLPEDVVRMLRDSRHDLPRLRGLTRVLRAKGWRLTDIAAPLSAHRSTVQIWERHPEYSLPAPDVITQIPVSPSMRITPRVASTSRRRAIAPNVPADDAKRIQELAPLARRARGGTPADSPYRKAARELDVLVRTHAARGVPIQRLADLAGVTYRAMKVRIDAP